MRTKNFFLKYSFLPPALLLATNLISSFVTRFFIDGRHLYNFTLPLDNAIPFVPEFIYIYVLAFLQWAICAFAVMIIDRDKNWYFCTGIAAGNLIAGVIFLVFPTVMSTRPEFSGGGALTELIGRFIFSADTPPRNIMPSVHCLSSWGCMRMIFALKRVPKSIKAFNAVFSVLVFLSVLFVKQHLIFDIPAGILAFEAGLIITKLTGIDKRLSALETRILT